MQLLAPIVVQKDSVVQVINMQFDNLLVEKYRPHTLDAIILPDETRKIIESFREKRELTNHLLLVSGPGQGKTSLAKIIVKDILQCDYLYLNASDENGIDTIRTKVISFAQTKSFNGDLKVVLLDEADSISPEAQRALRNVMEEYANNTRFILTANYKHKIIEPITSRCIALNFQHNVADVAKHCYQILKKEKIVIEDKDKQLFLETVKHNFPDIRKIINTLQRFSVSGKLEIPASFSNNEFVDTLFKNICNDALAARKLVIQSESVFQNDYHGLMKQLLEHVYQTSTLSTSQKQIIILILVERMYRHTFVVDAEINFFGCMLDIQKSLQ